MAAICHNAVNDPERAARFRNPGTVTYCLRVMVSVITLYDHVNPLGAFHKNSPINVRAAPRPGKGGGGARASGSGHGALTRLPAPSSSGALVGWRPFQMKSSIKLIQTQGGAQTETLLNALRYTTKHRNDADTPKAIKQLLG